MTSEIQYFAETKKYVTAASVPSELRCVSTFPVGVKVFVRQKNTGNILALGVVKDNFEGDTVITVTKRFT